MRFLKQTLILLAVGVLCAAVANALAGKERKLAWIGSYPNALQVPPPEETAPPPEPPVQKHAEQRRVEPQTEAQQPPAQQARKSWTAPSAQEAWNLFQQQAVFLDARRSEDYAAGHIAGARSFSVWEGDIETKLQQLPAQGVSPDSPIVTYCSGGNCEDSAILAEKLADLGYTRIYVYEGGFPEWQQQGRPVETGAGQ